MKKINDLKVIEQILSEIESAHSIAISIHVNPDGDCVGSMCAIVDYLKSKHKQVTCFSQHKISYNYSFLKNTENISKSIDKNQHFDLAIVLDCATEQRVSFYEDLKLQSKKMINIDHHKDNTLFGDINWIGNNASTGEMIWKMLTEGSVSITKSMAEALYVSLYTDTGGFRFSNTSAFSFEVAADLVSKKISVTGIVSNIYETKSFEELTLLAEILNSLHSEVDGKVIWAIQPKKDYEFTIETIDYMRMVNGSEIIILFKELDNNRVKVSLRAKGKNDVSEIAASFGGGGHKAASGMLMECSLNDAIERVIDYVKKVYIHE